MKKFHHLVIVFSLLFFFGSCIKAPVTNPNTPNNTTPKGKIIVYSNDISRFSVDVQVDGQPIGSITRNQVIPSDCNAAYEVVSEIDTGLHMYNAYLGGSKLWQQNITIKRDSCHKIFLPYAGQSDLKWTNPVDTFMSFKKDGVLINIPYCFPAKLNSASFPVNPPPCNLAAYNTWDFLFSDSYRYGAVPFCVGGCSDIHFKIKGTAGDRPSLFSYQTCSPTSSSPLELDQFAFGGSRYGLSPSTSDFLAMSITNVSGHIIEGIFNGTLTKYSLNGVIPVWTSTKINITEGKFRIRYGYFF